MLKKALPLLLALVVANVASAYNFSVELTSGQTIYLTITDANSVKVVAPESMSWEGFAAPTGRMVIPATVNNGGTTYNVTAIDRMAFTECYGLTSVSIPGSVVTIGMRAFAADTLLTSVTMGEGVQRIDMMAFFMCSSLDTIVLPNTIRRIAVSAFENTGYYSNTENWSGTMLTLGNWVLKVGNLTEGTVTVPEGIVGVANSSFFFCRYVDKVVLPKTLLYVGDGAFKSCFALDTLRVRANMPPSLSDDSFEDLDTLPILAVPFGRSSVYAAAQYWCDFTIVEDPWELYVSVIDVDEMSASAAVTASMVAGGIVVRHAEGIRLTVYDMAGHRVAVVNDATDEQYLPLPSAGIYVVQAGGRTVKISYSK